MDQHDPHIDLILYNTPTGAVKIEVIYQEETFWLSQKRMAELFGVDVRTVNEHLQNIYKTMELEKESTFRKIRIVQQEGNREVAREVEFYNLDAIIAVGYRVNSHEATQFRIWATNTLREFIIKGFVLDDERLKQGKRFGKDCLYPFTQYRKTQTWLGKYGKAAAIPQKLPMANSSIKILLAGARDKEELPSSRSLNNTTYGSPFQFKIKYYRSTALTLPGIEL